MNGVVRVMEAKRREGRHRMRFMIQCKSQFSGRVYRSIEHTGYLVRDLEARLPTGQLAPKYAWQQIKWRPRLPCIRNSSNPQVSDVHYQEASKKFGSSWRCFGGPIVRCVMREDVIDKFLC